MTHTFCNATVHNRNIPITRARLVFDAALSFGSDVPLVHALSLFDAVFSFPVLARGAADEGKSSCLTIHMQTHMSGTFITENSYIVEVYNVSILQ